MKRIKIVFTLTVLLMVILVKPSFADESVVKDPVLRQYVKDSLMIKTEPTEQDMEQLVELNIRGHVNKILSYEGMEYATNLRYFALTGPDHSSDFSIFEGLEELRSFRLSHFDMTSDQFPTFKVQPYLTEIEYSFTNLDSAIYEKLQQTPSIQKLKLRNNRREGPGLETLEGLQYLPNLEYLDVWSNGITDFSIIDQFPSLKEITAFGQFHKAPDANLVLSDLPWNAETETLTIPLSLFDNLFYDFEGTAYLPGPNNRQVLLKGIDSNSKTKYLFARLESGDFIVDGISREQMQNIGSIEIYTTLDEGYDINKKPDFLDNYWASNVTYNKMFFTSYDNKEFKVMTVDENNNEIDAEYTMSGLYLSPYTIGVKDIPGYTFVESSSALSSHFDQGIESVVTLTYKKDVLPTTDVYTVTFDSNGGSAVNPITNVASGSIIDKPADPTRTGYTFVEWTKNNLTWNFDSMKITEDTTLVAVWKKEVAKDTTKPEVQTPEVVDKGNTNNNGNNTQNNNSNTTNTEKLPATGVASSSFLSYLLIGLGSTVVVLNKRMSKRFQ